MAEIAKEWKELKDKTKYEKLAEEDKKRYQKEMDQLMTQGYFVNQDGVKSTDIAPKKQKKI